MDQRSYELKVDDKIMTAFKEHCKNKDYIKDIENKYNASLVLMPGKAAADFTLFDANNKEYKLSDFKGKNLLIDVWGVFCGPCIREVPFLKQIEQDYKGKNIEFVCVCFEEKSEVWLNKIKELDLKGIQLTAKGGWHSQFRMDYQINWVPTYILIDNDGKIIDARAPKPSDNLRDLLNMTLNK
jgi:thiol-disulfide isomerase/thioredoxin